MGKSKTSGKGRLDKFYYLAKEQGYRSRAAFKLVQLNRKYQFLENSRALLDLCAAPGGWLQVAAKYMPVSSLIVGVDLVPIRPIRGCQTLTEDITSSKCRSEIKKLLQGGLLDVVLHDGSPNVGGAWAKEAMSQAALSLDALKLATEYLRPGGTFVSKVFRSQDYNALLYAFKQLFHKVEATKPLASRATSAEIYVICTGYRCPAKIDPRLLDMKHVFKEVAEPPKVMDVLSEGKRKRSREGYEEGATMVRKTGAAAKFVASAKPVEFLGTCHVITFVGDEGRQIQGLPETDEEVRALCEDLRVLGKREFRHLLKWRMAVRKVLPAVAGLPAADGAVAEGPAEGGTGGAAEDKEEKEEQGVLDEMQELRDIMDAKRSRARKLLARRRDKAKARTATGMQTDALTDVYGDEGLFSLGAIKSKKQLQGVAGAAPPDDGEAAASSSGGEEGPDAGPMVSDSDNDDDARRLHYQADMEEYFEEAYQRYRKATDGSTKRRARARLAGDGQNGELWGPEGEDNAGRDASIGGDAGVAEAADEENPLLESLEQRMGPEEKKAALAAQWFSQDVFDELEAPGGGPPPPPLGGATTSDEEDFASEGTAGSDEEAAPSPPRRSTKKGPKNVGAQNGAGGAHAAAAGAAAAEGKQGGQPYSGGALAAGREEDEAEGFEVVPAADVGSTSGDSESASSGRDDYDSDAKAETLAYARRMLRKRAREEILDDAYNRYTFDDTDVPRWFAEDERRHAQPQRPVTKEEVAAIKAQNKAIDARPVKKVAEAKARKRRVALKKLEAVRQKAASIADQPDLNARAKNQLMERLYKNADSSKARDRKKTVVVAKKGAMGNRGKSAGKGAKMVDRRMKKDARGLKGKAQKSTKGKKGRAKPPAGKVKRKGGRT